MKQETEELIKAENQLHHCFFVRETLQGGKIRPATYIHEIDLSLDLYFELKEQKIINHESLATYKVNPDGRKVWAPIAFFEFRQDRCIISFSHIFNREDFRSMIDRYIIIRELGYYPLKTNWISKMNFDRNIELMVRAEPVIRNKATLRKLIKI